MIKTQSLKITPKILSLISEVESYPMEKIMPEFLVFFSSEALIFKIAREIQKIKYII